MTTAIRPLCQETIGQTAGDFGLRPVLCSQIVGVRQWYDSEGTLHAGCALHVRAMVSRFPEADPPEPRWLHEECPPYCPSKVGGDHDHTPVVFTDHPADATVETEYATYWTTGRQTA